jgi:hypothetical protein
MHYSFAAAAARPPYATPASDAAPASDGALMKDDS